MFWALAAGAIDTRGFEFEHVLQDIQTLNEWALEGRLEVTAISLHAYPFVQDQYVAAPARRQHGLGLRPDRRRARAAQLRAAALSAIEIAVPGRMTTAFLVLPALRSATFATARCRSTRSLDEVSSGRADAGLVIHEGQLTYEADGLREGARPGRVVAARDRAAAAARRQRGAARRRRRDAAASSPRCCATSIQAGLANRERGDALRDAVRPRPRQPARRPLRRHVRERADERLRRRGSPGGRRAAPPRRGDRRLPEPSGSTSFPRSAGDAESCERCAARCPGGPSSAATVHVLRRLLAESSSPTGRRLVRPRRAA